MKSVNLAMILIFLLAVGFGAYKLLSQTQEAGVEETYPYEEERQAPVEEAKEEGGVKCEDLIPKEFGIFKLDSDYSGSTSSDEEGWEIDKIYNDPSGQQTIELKLAYWIGEIDSEIIEEYKKQVKESSALLESKELNFPDALWSFKRKYSYGLTTDYNTDVLIYHKTYRLQIDEENPLPEGLELEEVAKQIDDLVKKNAYKFGECLIV